MESYKILIVDDDPNIREVLSVLLGSEGYSVQQAENGETALEIVNGGRPLDLVILDIMMPGLSGVEDLYQNQRDFIGAGAVSDSQVPRPGQD